MKKSASWLLAAAVFPIAMATALAGPPVVTNNPVTLVAKGDNYRLHGQLTQALLVYRQAAKAGNVNGDFAAGEMLFDEGQVCSDRERILKLSQGIDYLFSAATNRLPEACAELSKALQNGVWVQTNLISAYAWMELAAEHNRSYRANLDQLVVQMSPDQIQTAQNLAHQYSLGHWPKDLVRPVDEGDPRLKIQGITIGGRVPMVVLNSVTFSQGDTLEVVPAGRSQHPGPGRLTVSCLEIGNDYVLVSIAGESHLKLLSTEHLQ